MRRGSTGGTAQAGDNQVLPITWSDNDITLWPGESQTLTATYRAALLHGASPVVSVYGWNVPAATFAAPDSSAAATAVHNADVSAHLQHFGVAAGTPTGSVSPQPGVGTPPGTGGAQPTAATASSKPKAPAWTVSSVASSPDTTPATSFTQGDSADTYTLVVKNTGNAPTDGTTPVTLTDIVDPNISMTSISGAGWTCDTSDDPTEVCTETGGSGGGPAVLQPGQSYPPITLTVQVPLGTGFGTQESTDGLHVTNGVIVTGGAASQPSTSLASPTPIVGLPGLTADNAIDGAFRQGGTGRYEITVLNTGGAPTTGSSSDPISATITAMPTGVTVQALYGSGWTCSLTAITTPVTEPADTCYRSDVLAGENGEEPPITVVASVATTAAATGNETVKIDGGGNVGGPSSVSAATTVQQAADLNAASGHPGAFAQGDSADSYTLTVSNVDGPNAPTTGGPALGLVWVTDSLPWGLTATSMSGSGWTCRVDALTCYRTDTLAAGSSYPLISLTVKVAADAPASVTNSVTVGGGGMTSGANSSTSAGGQTGTDPTTISQSGPAGTPPTPPVPAQLSISSSHAGAFGQGDAAASYTLKVSNGASAGLTTGMVVVSDGLPAGLTPAEMTGAGWSCSLAAPTLPVSAASRRTTVYNTFQPQPTCYRFDSLPPGGSYPPITLAVAVANNTQPSVTNDATVAGGSSAAADDTDATAVSQLPQLVVTSYDSAGGVPYAPFGRGGASQHDVYHVTVANDGFAPTSGTVTFAADLPGGVQALSIAAPGWSCDAASASCRTNPGVTLAAGQQDQITLTVGVTGDAPADLQTFLQASGGGQSPAAGLDENNDYSTVSNGGEYADPTYVQPAH